MGMMTLWVLVAAISLSHAQENETVIRSETVYFKSASYQLQAAGIKKLDQLVMEVDSLDIQDITLYGYTDDQGSASYNKKLSQDRVMAVTTYLKEHGIIQDVNSTIVGRGEIELEQEEVDKRSVAEIRKGNRRVDIVVTILRPVGDPPAASKKGSIVIRDTKEPYKQLLSKDLDVGDIIRLEDVYFYEGRSILVPESYPVLNRVATILVDRPEIMFELRGHVCCIARKYKDAIDRATRKKNLSHARARSIFKYLERKGVSKSRMRYKGYGRQFPLGGADAYDRRVEIKILSMNAKG